MASSIDITPRAAAQPQAPGRSLYALLVEFEHTHELIAAAEKIKAAGYRRWDAYTPFPVHGLDQAMGVTATKLPWIVFFCGLAGAAGGLVMQWWMNASDPKAFYDLVPTFLQGYQFLISGKPYFSVPANIPVMFETTVLFSAFGAFFGMLALNRLPTFYNPLFSSPRFKGATDDKFLLAVMADDPQFDLARTTALLSDVGGTVPERIYAEPAAPLPRFLRPTFVVLALLALLPIAWIFKSRSEYSPKTRIRVVQDMGTQDKYLPQTVNLAFADRRADRLPVAGTVARGDLQLDEHLSRGIVNGQWATTLPAAVLNQPGGIKAVLARGQERYNISCMPCHGYDGLGDGPVQQRALQLQESAWVKPSNLHEDVYLKMPAGQIFNTITYGIRTMGPYGPVLPPEDRWAIIAYVRALQASQRGSLAAVPPAERARLEALPVSTQPAASAPAK